MTKEKHTGGAFTEILDVLARHRNLLVGLYCLVLGAWVILFLIFGPEVFPEVFHEKLAINEGLANAQEFKKEIWNRLGMTGGFLALQLLFIWGGGRIYLAEGSTKMWKLGISVVIFSILMAILTTGLLTTFWEMMDRLGTAGTIRFAQNRPDNDEFMVLLKTLVLSSWIPWLVIGLLCVRRTDHPTGLGRLAVILLAGSWVEFAVALPIDLAVRSRTKECPCASASWMTLLFCLPILLWSIGPAIYLLYLRERRLTRKDSRHAQRILFAKTARSRKSAKGQ